MTMSGYTAIVGITNLQIGSGYYKHEYSSSADMALEGVLRDFWFGDFRDRLAHLKAAVATISIDFVNDNKYDKTVDDLTIGHGSSDSCIGAIHSHTNDGTDLYTTVHITLPFSRLDTIYSLRGERITFDTVHEVVEVPTPEQKADGIVALVNRVYFQVRHRVA